MRILVRDGAEQHDAREVLAVGLGAAHLLHEVEKLLLVIPGLLDTGEGFVVAEEAKHHIGLHQLQVGGHGDLAGAAREGIRAVAADAHGAEAHLLLRQLALQKRLHPAIVLHAVRQAVAEDGHDIALLEGKRQRVAIPGGHLGHRRLRRAGGCGLFAGAGGRTGDRLAGFAVVAQVGGPALMLDIHFHHFWRRNINCSEDLLAVRIEELEREAIQAALITLAVPDADLFDVLGLAEIDFPPGIRRT